jgi:hypothetical protein
MITVAGNKVRGVVCIVDSLVDTCCNQATAHLALVFVGPHHSAGGGKPHLNNSGQVLVGM